LIPAGPLNGELERDDFQKKKKKKKEKEKEELIILSLWDVKALAQWQINNEGKEDNNWLVERRRRTTSANQAPGVIHVSPLPA
jgi:hypothetical protein